MKILIFYKEETLEAEMSSNGHILIWQFLLPKQLSLVFVIKRMWQMCTFISDMLHTDCCLSQKGICSKNTNIYVHVLN